MDNQLIKAAVLTHPKQIEVEQREMPQPKEDEVLIRIRTVGICGSDVHYYEHGRIGRYVVEKPIILGHEASGEIVSVGSKVTHLHAGQRVAIEPGATCGECDYCKSGRYNLCPHVKFLATPPYDGAFAEYVTMRSDVVFPIPDDFSFETAALIEPFSVGLHAIRRGELKQNETVIIMGMGPVGLLTVVNAKLAGASTIIGVDLEQSRLDLALEMGATHTINLREESLAQKVMEATNYELVDVAFETAGNPKAVQGAVASVKRGGRVVIVGMSPQDEVPVNISHIVDSEIDLRGIFRYHHTYPASIELLSNKDVNIDKIITSKYSLDQTGAAFEKALQDKANTVKIMVYPE